MNLEASVNRLAEDCNEIKAGSATEREGEAAELIENVRRPTTRRDYTRRGGREIERFQAKF